MKKYCPKCELSKPLDDFYSNKARGDGRKSYCKLCSQARKQTPQYKAKYNAWKKAQGIEPGVPGRKSSGKSLRELTRNSHLKIHYGMLNGEAGFQALLTAQGSKCLVCGTAEPGGKGSFHVDHDRSCCPGTRSCGKCVRGLLCHRCNLGIGLLRDDPEILRAAADYIERFRAGKDL